MSMTSQGPYEHAWSSYRRWSRAFWLLFLLFLPAMDLLYRIELRVYGGGRLLGLAIAVWMSAIWITGLKKGNFRCPRCGESFFVAWDNRRWHQTLYSRLWTRKFLHCGLPKWTTIPPAA